MPLNREIHQFSHGVENLLRDELISQSASPDSLNWFNQDGKLILLPGNILVGASGAVGSVTGGIFGYKVDSTQVHWRKIGTKIQYLAGTTWTDVITGLTSSADYSFANYTSLAGSFTFAGGADGIFKMNNANPGSYIAMYDSTINFKGKILINKGRMLLFDRPEDKTGLYGSWVDNQLVVAGGAGVYTIVTGEATTSLTGTLAFKAGSAFRNCFALTITLTASGEVYTEHGLGILTGSLGGTGTINYITGAYTLSNSGVGTAAYRWENSNVRGITDFTLAATRVAYTGFVVPQSEGGDPIINVVIGSNGYYSLKSNSAYKFYLSPDDDLTKSTNEVYRKQLGVQSYRGALSTGTGIIFINTNAPEKPEMTILTPNLAGDSLVPKVLFPHFKFANYKYDDCTIETYERYILVACKTQDAVNNDILLLCDMTNGTVNITNYSGRIFTTAGGLIYMGSSISQSTFEIFSGFDDNGSPVLNYWTGKGEAYPSTLLRYATFGQSLKKFRKMRLKGSISANQNYEVHISYDDAGYQLVGTVLGSGSYVDYSAPQSIGSHFIGETQIGGDVLTDIYPYYMEIALRKVPKFRKRNVKFVALGIGYVDVRYQMDYDISMYEQKIPGRFRQKQNVNLAGTLVDQ